jgi:hypothetical protein
VKTGLHCCRRTGWTRSATSSDSVCAKLNRLGRPDGCAHEILVMKFRRPLYVIAVLRRRADGRVAVVAVGAPFRKTFPSDFSYRDFTNRPSTATNSRTAIGAARVRSDGPDGDRVERCHRDRGRGQRRASGAVSAQGTAPVGSSYRFTVHRGRAVAQKSAVAALVARLLAEQERPRRPPRCASHVDPKSKSLPAGSPNRIAECHGHSRITRP